MTTASTVASLVVTFSLVFDFLSTKNFSNSGSGLTSKQKELVIIIMILLLYLSLGSLVFSLILEDLTFINSLYFTICTLTTVGFGDIVPNTTGSRIFLFFFAPIGIMIVALVITTARLTILEEFQQLYIRRRQKFKEKHEERSKQRKEQHDLRRKVRRVAATGRGGTGLVELLPTLSLPRAPIDATLQQKPANSWSPKTAFNRWKSGAGLSKGSLENGWSRKKAVVSPSNSSQAGSTTDPMIPDYNKESVLASPRDSLPSVWKGKEKRRMDQLDENGSPASSLGILRRVESPSQMTNQSHTSNQDYQSQVQEAERDQAEGRAADRDDLGEEVAQMEAALQAQREALEDDWKRYRREVHSSEQTEFWTKLGVSWTLFLVSRSSTACAKPNESVRDDGSEIPSMMISERSL